MKLKFPKHTILILNRQPLAGTTLVNWIKVLLENNLHISLQYIPRAIYVSLLIIFTTPLRYIEKKKYKTKIKNTKIKDPIFIIGHWRSGTTFLHYLLSKDKNLSYVSTMETLGPNIFLAYEKMLNNIVSNSLPSKRPMDNLEMKTYLPYEEEYAISNLSPYSFYHAWYFPHKIEDYFKKYVLFEDVSENIISDWKKNYIYFLKKISYKNKGRQIILKSLVNTAKIKHILEMFPDAKFIHLCRNPYPLYYSTWKLYNSILPIFSFQNVDKEKLDNAIIKIYKKLYLKYIEEKNLIPTENLIEIKYEEFINDPLKTVEGIYKQFKINSFNNAKPMFENYIKKHENYKKNHHNIDEKIKEKIYNEWEFAFKKFNYSK